MAVTQAPVTAPDTAGDDAARAWLLGGSSLAGMSSAARTLSRDDLAAMRPAAPPRPRRRRQPGPPPLPPAQAASAVVFAGIVCFCGRRFAPGDAAEFMTHLRAEVGEDLAMLARIRGWKAKSEARPEARAAAAERARRRHATPEGRAKEAAYRARPEVHEARRAYQREYLTRPGVREARNAQRREARAAQAHLCACGCGEMTGGPAPYRRGHHMRPAGGASGPSA